jgi:hypothetical protein
MSEAMRIAALNDAFRARIGDPRAGKFYVTDGVSSCGHAFVARAIAAVKGFADFTPDNDPYGEHDFGSVLIDGQKLFWKIDYFDRADPDLVSPDASDASVTERVLTIMLADEY